MLDVCDQRGLIFSTNGKPQLVFFLYYMHKYKFSFGYFKKYTLQSFVYFGVSNHPFIFYESLIYVIYVNICMLIHTNTNDIENLKMVGLLRRFKTGCISE